jgi:predicted MPP superfamily phosphohydrolase
MDGSSVSPETVAEAEDVELSISNLPFLVFIRGVAIVGLITALIGGLHYYIGSRLFSGLSRGASAAGWALIALLFASIPGGFAASRFAANVWTRMIQWVSHVWIGAFGVLLTACVAFDFVRFSCVLLGIATDGTSLRGVESAAIALVSVPSLVWGFRIARGRPNVQRVHFPVPGLAPELEGLKIVQITDIHIGPTLGREFLERVVNQVNSLGPDIVAITGDLVDGDTRSLGAEVAPIARLQSRLGTFFVTGNHEYYHGPKAWEAEVARNGITVLHNEHRVLSRGGSQLVIAGVTDHDGGRFDPAHAPRPDLAFAGAPTGVPRILLAHQPRTAGLASHCDVTLQLSGHTHGGQMFPFMYFVRLQQPVIRGLHTIAGVPVYTSQGTGYWGPPFRIGTSPEITEITLSSAPIGVGHG